MRPSDEDMAATTPSSIMTRWCLESLADGGKTIRRVPIDRLPFRIGRRPGLELTLPSASVSKDHAEIDQNGDSLLLKDLRSTNGTFVNSERVSSMALKEGDIIHFADFEFRLGRDRPEELTEDKWESDVQTMAVPNLELPHQFVEGTRQLGELLKHRAVTPVFQPIINLNNGDIAAYEVLGRGCHPDLPKNPKNLFHIAASVGVEVELSQLFIRKALEMASRHPELPPLFLNTHPAELEDPDLPRMIGSLLRISPRTRVVLEFHEAVLDDIERIARLRKEFTQIGVGLAYDDFGSGRARIRELGDVPPDYLKFDIGLVSGIDKAPMSRVRLINGLVTTARDLNVLTIAEGIETQAEADICFDLGFAFGQGYLFGYPLPLDKD
jgi:EAL domain-containing protein (putative c-di-GMP-specific phosphodiesterase class I)